MSRGGRSSSGRDACVLHSHLLRRPLKLKARSGPGAGEGTECLLIPGSTEGAAGRWAGTCCPWTHCSGLAAGSGLHPRLSSPPRLSGNPQGGCEAGCRGHGLGFAFFAVGGSLCPLWLLCGINLKEAFEGGCRRFLSAGLSLRDGACGR